VAEVTTYSDIFVNVFFSVGRADRIGFTSTYAKTEHPGTGTKISGFKWDKRTWPAPLELPDDRVAPTLLDPTFATTVDSDWQSGIGDGDDLKLLRIEKEYISLNPSGEVWAPYVNHGHFYSYRDEFYLYSEGLRTEYFDTTLDSGGFQQTTLSGELKPGVPISVYQREYDSDRHRWIYLNQFKKRYDFTALAVSGEHYDIRDDSDDLIHTYVDHSSPEFIARYETSSNNVTLTLNDSYLQDNAEDVLLSGVSGYCELLGVSDGVSDQSYYTTYSPLLSSGTRVFTYTSTASPSEWVVASGEVPVLLGSGLDCIVDHDWGTLSFGDGTNGDVPALGSNVAIQYTSTVGIDYEIDHSPDYYIAKFANTNVTRGQPTEGFITTQAQQVSAASIELSAVLDQISENLYSPLNIGSTHAELEAVVRGQNGEVLTGQDVTFYISGVEFGSFGSGATSTISATDTQGRARAFFIPPASIDELGDASADVTHSGVNTTILFPDLPMPYSGAQLYTFKVMNEDVIEGIPAADLSDYYSDYFSDEDINYTSLSDETTNEGSYRSAHDLPTPTTYAAGDLNTGKKLAVLVYDYNAIDPDEGTAGAYNLIDPTSSTWEQDGVRVEYVGALDIPSSTTDFRSYFVVAPTQVKLRASTWSEHLRRNVYSSEITIRIEIPDNMSGVYAVDAIESVSSGVLNRLKTYDEVETYAATLISGGVFIDDDLERAFQREKEPSTETPTAWFLRTRRTDSVLLGLEDVSTAETGAFEVPLGFRLRSSSVTAASAIGAVTFLDVNVGSVAVWIARAAAGVYSGTFADIAHDGHGLWCAVGESAEIQTSPGGVTWTKQTIGVGYAGHLYGVAHNGETPGLGGRWCAVGPTGEIQTSEEGAAWIRQTAAGGFVDVFRDVAHDGSNLWCAVGHSGEIQTSPDGEAWTAQIAAGGAGDFHAVAHDGFGQWCAVGTGGVIQTSPDGEDWTAQVAAGGFGNIFYGVTHNGGVPGSRGQWCAVGDNGEIQTSPDGATWTAETPDGFVGGAFKGIVKRGDSLWCVVGWGAGIQTSPDGAAWTARSAEIPYVGTFTSVAHNTKGLFCAVGASGGIQTSFAYPV